jgi:hypothetical protein
MLLLGFINRAGLLLFLVGMLFAFPFTSLALTAGYLLVASLESRPLLESCVCVGAQCNPLTRTLPSS